MLGFQLKHVETQVFFQKHSKTITFYNFDPAVGEKHHSNHIWFAPSGELSLPLSSSNVTVPPSEAAVQTTTWLLPVVRSKSDLISLACPCSLIDLDRSFRFSWDSEDFKIFQGFDVQTFWGCQQRSCIFQVVGALRTPVGIRALTTCEVLDAPANTNKFRYWSHLKQIKYVHFLRNNDDFYGFWWIWMIALMILT